MRITTKITWDISTGDVLKHEFHSVSDETPVALCCGASQGQKDVGQQQTSLFNQLTQQSQQVFGNSSTVFNDLISSFAPVVAAGPNQEGFSQGEKSNLDSQAITNTGQAYKNASQAVRESEAAVGGGNVSMPGGADIGKDLSIAESAAQQTSSELGQINEANYATGRDNYFKAATDLENATNVFNPSTEAGNAATGSGKAAADTQNQIAQENNSWVSAVTGALSGIAGDVVTGGMKNLGQGSGFFGQNSAPPGQ